MIVLLVAFNLFYYITRDMILSSQYCSSSMHRGVAIAGSWPQSWRKLQSHYKTTTKSSLQRWWAILALMLNCFSLFPFCGMVWSCSYEALFFINPFWFSQDGTANDIPTDLAVEGYPTIYFYSTTGDLYTYNGGRTAEDIISFIKKNKGPRTGAVDEMTQTGAGAIEEGIAPSLPSELPKDELRWRCHM